MISTYIPYLKGNEQKYLNQCVKENFVSSAGAFVNKFENKFSKIFKYKYNIAVNSGTSALHVALLALGVKENDIVITQSYTFAATANSILYCKAKPWFFDISPESLTLDLNNLENILKKKTKIQNNQCILKGTNQIIKAILPVLSLGLVPDLDRLIKISKKYKLKILLDAAAGHGALYKSKKISSRKITSCFSFNGNKAFTCGGGGIISTFDKPFAKKIRNLSTVAKRTNGYGYNDVGFNYKITNIQAAIGLAQLENFSKIMKIKKKIFEKYKKKLTNNKKIVIHNKLSWQNGVDWIFFIKINKKINNKLIIFFKKNGISINKFWVPLHTQKPYRNFNKETLKATNFIWDRILILPSHPGLKNFQQNKVINTINQYFK